MRLSTTTTRTRILALPLLLLLLLMVTVAVTNATPLPPSPSPPPSDFSEIEALWAVGQTEVSTCYMLHVILFTEQQEEQRTRTTRAAEKYTHIHICLQLSHPLRLFIIPTSTNQPTCLTCMYHRVPHLSDPHHSKKSTPARVFERVKLPHGLLLVSLEEEEEEERLRGLRRRWILGVWLVLRRRGGGG